MSKYDEMAGLARLIREHELSTGLAEAPPEFAIEALRVALDLYEKSEHRSAGLALHEVALDCYCVLLGLVSGRRSSAVKADYMEMMDLLDQYHELAADDHESEGDRPPSGTP